MKPAESYFRSLYYLSTAGAATAKHSYYPALANLLNEVGRGLKPRVRCLLNLKELGPGLPDGGLFTANQFPKSKSGKLPATPPGRGAIEVLDSGADLDAAAYSPEVIHHLKKYRYLLLTNFWRFLLLGLDADEEPVELESYSLAEHEDDFWSQVSQPRYLATLHGDRLAEFLKRAMLYAVPLDTAPALAQFLASYGRELNSRLENAAFLAAEPVQAAALLETLDQLRAAFETGLGLRFEVGKNNRILNSVLVQTVFCAIFSAWVLWHYDEPDSPERFDWRLTHWHLRLPLLHALFKPLTKPGPLTAPDLDLTELFEAAGETLNRVDRAEFFEAFKPEQVVPSFYESFLQALSPALRKALGVWSTPPEAVKYMVAQVDRALREELGVADGLADEQVMILDPCCGSGAYLLAAIAQIAATLQQKGDEALAGYYAKKAALKRVLGFEIVPAALVMAHLQMALLLQRLDMPFSRTERPGIYLANMLGADSGQAVAEFKGLPELQAEHDAAGLLQQERKFLVILGHPPHGPYEPYLDFFKLAEQKLVERGAGLICYLADYTWLDAPHQAKLRQRYLESFDRIWIDCLNGDKQRTGNLTPEGEPDPNPFSTRSNRAGSGRGAAIALLVRQQPHSPAKTVHFRNWWGKDKLARLVEAEPAHVAYQALEPAAQNGCLFMPPQYLSEYATWPLLTELLPLSFPALTLPVQADAAVKAGLTPLEKYAYRPLDLRSLEPAVGLNEKPRELVEVVQANNLFLVCGKKAEPGQEGPPIYVTRFLADKSLVHSGGACFPMTLKGLKTAQQSLFDQLPQRVPANLSAEAYRYLLHLAIPDPEADPEVAGLIGYHILAMSYAPLYSVENKSGLSQDWPRLPLPNQKNDLRKSAALGQKIAALLDPESAVQGVTSGQIRPELKLVAILKRVNEDHPEADLAVTTFWGSSSPNGANPAEGRLVERSYTSAEQAAIEKGAAGLGLTLNQLDHYFGATTCDIYLNESAYWANIPLKVWEYTIGGYPVLKSWLSYRHRQILGRSLRSSETQAFTALVRRITALVLLEPVLDANYQAVKKATFTWSIHR